MLTPALITIMLLSITAASIPYATAQVNSTLIIQSSGIIVTNYTPITLTIQANPARTTTPLLITGTIGESVNNSTVNIQFSKNQNSWIEAGSVTAKPNGAFEAAVSFPSSGTYQVKVTSGNQVSAFTQLVVDRIVNLDGSEDATDIQSAINSLPTSGGIVYLRAGLYELNGRHITVRTGLSLIGDGIDKTIVRLYPVKSTGPECDDAITSYTAVNNLLIENFTLIQNRFLLQHHGGIVLRGSPNYNITIKNMKVTDISGWAICPAYSTNLIIQNCNIQNTWTAIIAGYSQNVIIQGNSIKNTGGDGILLEEQASNILIADNYLENIGDTAIDIYGLNSVGVCPVEHVVASNNTIVNGPVRVTNAKDIQVANNNIINGNIMIDAGQGTPVDISITGNHIVTSAKNAIGFYGAENSSATKNIIEMTTPKPTVTQAGIAAAIWTNGVIENNVILNSANSGIDFGGWGLGSGNNITIQNNRIENYGNYGVYDNGKSISIVTVQGNTFITTKATSTAIFNENTANQWIKLNNTIKTP
jgi:hypothetical protein